jgi:hypothetical protein
MYLLRNGLAFSYGEVNHTQQYYLTNYRDKVYPESMPCNDVTEVLSLTLDPDDRLTHYSLIKLTCGGGVGNPSLLKKWIANKPASEILSTSTETILEEFPTPSDTWYLRNRNGRAWPQRNSNAGFDQGRCLDQGNHRMWRLRNLQHF